MVEDTVALPQLRTVSPQDPGWTRRRAGRGFVYLDRNGKRLADDDTHRYKLLMIPPAWEAVWICPSPNGHLQAVGTDGAGRRQYLYHQQWRINRDKSKHDRVLTVASRLLPPPWPPPTHPPKGLAARRRSVSVAMKQVSGYLGNTPSVARKSYVDPRVIDLFNDRVTISPTLATADIDLSDGYTHGKIESAVLNLLRDES